ncbi:MAG: ParA family protein [Bacteroidota bacterium]
MMLRNLERPYVLFVTIKESIGLIAGDLELSLFEDQLGENWTKCLDGDERAFRIISAFYRIISNASEAFQADYNVIDIGPNLGAINRATLIAADYVIMPMAADLFSIQGLKNLGNRLQRWRREWADRKSRNPEPSLQLPNGIMRPLGYVIMQHGINQRRPVKSYLRWANRIPEVFRNAVLEIENTDEINAEQDNYCLALLKHYHSLMPMSMEARKPMFLLKPADGAIGAHLGAARAVYKDFKELVEKVTERIMDAEQHQTLGF